MSFRRGFKNVSRLLRWYIYEIGADIVIRINGKKALKNKFSVTAK